MKRLSLRWIHRLLKEQGWKSNDLLLNPQNDKVLSALEWTIDYLKGFRRDDHHAWECSHCYAIQNDDPDHQNCWHAEGQFQSLIHVRKNRSGDYVEV